MRLQRKGRCKYISIELTIFSEVKTTSGFLVLTYLNLQICGSTFPPECNLRADVVYTCIEIGDAPIYKKGCLSGVCPPNADDCEEELKCVCLGAGDVSSRVKVLSLSFLCGAVFNHKS